MIDLREGPSRWSNLREYDVPDIRVCASCQGVHPCLPQSHREGMGVRISGFKQQQYFDANQFPHRQKENTDDDRHLYAITGSLSVVFTKTMINSTTP
jgi:hypothetical protein